MVLQPSRRHWAGKLDMYRRVPVDLMEGTRRGSLFSGGAVVVMLLLFLMETRVYFSSTTHTDLSVDTNREAKLRVNLNITLLDVPCDYTVIDVVSVLGTEQNVTAHVSKWHVNGQGIRQRYQGRNREQHDIELFDPVVSDSLEHLLKDGEDAISLDDETFAYALQTHAYVFVDMYASWCSHCRDLAPTWEVLAELMSDVAENIMENQATATATEGAAGAHDYNEEEYAHAKTLQQPVFIGKVDCVVHKELCRKQQIMAYPTLRLFVDGERWKGGDYRSSRTLVSMADWLRRVEDDHKAEIGSDSERTTGLALQAAQEYSGMDSTNDTASTHHHHMDDEAHVWADKVRRHKQRQHSASSSQHAAWVDAEHPGCQLVGHLLLDRVPSHFSIMARSPHHDIEPRSTNVSHMIHSLSLGEPLAQALIQKGEVVPVLSSSILRKLQPMNGYVYVNEELHEAYHHYLKVITTNVEGLKTAGHNARDLYTYQILESSQLSYYPNDRVPEAKFILDLSPIAVSYRTSRRRWYDYVTSILAIVGGTFTVVGMLESSFALAISRRKRFSS